MATKAKKVKLPNKGLIHSFQSNYDNIKFDPPLELLKGEKLVIQTWNDYVVALINDKVVHVVKYK